MENFRKQKSLDSFCRKTKKEKYCDWPLAKFIQKNRGAPLLFYKYGKTHTFSTNSLDIHFVKNEKTPNFLSLDGFLRFDKKLPIRYAVRNRYAIWEKIKKDFGGFGEYWREAFKNPWREMSMVKVWNFSIVGSLIFGMFLMTFIYRYLGQNAAAVSVSSVRIQEDLVKGQKNVLGESIEVGEGETEKEKMKSRERENHIVKIEEEYVDGKTARRKMEERIKKMVKGYPIEKMVPLISEQDPIVAAFLISIAKKESNWGKRVPVLDGEDCDNYWGFRGSRKKMGTGGHTCFDSSKDAIDTVAKRIKQIIYEEGINTPEKMVTIWKCGYDCSWDDPANVRKWVSDVERYFGPLMAD